jgi:hypothetical protein
MFNHATHRLQREFPQAVMTLNGVPRFQKFLQSIRDQAPATDFKDLGIFEIRNRYVTTCSWFDLPLRQLDEEVANMGLVSLLEALTIKVSGVSSRCFPEQIALSATFGHDKYVAKPMVEYRLQAILEVNPETSD